MTKTTKLLLSGLVAMTLSMHYLSAQNADYRHVISGNAGLNIFQVFSLAEFTSFGDVSFTKGEGYGSPTLQLGYDIGVNNWFSLGLAFAHNRFGAKYTDLVIENNTIGALDMKYTRNTITSRILFHYGNAGRLDMYSGLRLGASLWDANPSKPLTENESLLLLESGGFASAKDKGTFPHIGMTLFGLRYYVTNNIGLGFESNLGSYLASVQLNARFGGGGSTPSRSKSSYSKKKRK